MITPVRARSWNAVAVLGAAVSIIALAALLGWALTRPGDSAGDGLAALETTSAPTPSTKVTDPPAASRALPRPTARDASVGALAASVAPAPTRLVIKDLGVDATVDPVGVQKDGAMVIPAEPTSVGWYRYGSAPSDGEGHTVIAGHVATREDGAGALAALRDAEPGMVVKVTDAGGKTTRYTVTGREKIVKKTLPVDEIFARVGKPRLVLITCGGEYIPELRSHRDNIVVTATPLP